MHNPCNPECQNPRSSNPDHPKQNKNLKQSKRETEKQADSPKKKEEGSNLNVQSALCVPNIKTNSIYIERTKVMDGKCHPCPCSGKKSKGSSCLNVW
jgi:hypothetical protein